MNEHNFLTYSGKIIVEILGEILYFPLWWYSTGLVRLLRVLVKFWNNQVESIGFIIWLKNIFVPMYGQRDFASRLISFVIRSIQVIFRGGALLILLALLLLIIVLWLAFPILLFKALIFQFSK